ncbi:MAG: Gfo/Idh/MocA family oxidoreductase [Chloroflexota bacterium]|nr:Gfo/Idh/MocA family oxidoreductase [Chloroflexota bacterium]
MAGGRIPSTGVRSSRPLELVMVGAGNRGHLSYGAYALRYPEQVRFVAVAEPDEGRRHRFADAHGIPPERQFRGWEELAERPRMGVGLVNATMDPTHRSSAVALLECGYHMLLEKPMATSPRECVEIVGAAEQHGRMLQIGHVLRYSAFFRAIREAVSSGRLGPIVSVDWRENLVYWHYAHSFVRGNWANSGRTGPLILTKCCHDLDLLTWMFGPCEQVASAGSLRHFTPAAMPAPAPDRCTDGCPIADECPYYAPRVYLERYRENPNGFTTNALTLDRTPEGIMRALTTGPYGRCVYRCDNDVVDHQVVLMVFLDGLSVSLTMQGGSHVEGRTARIDGRRATLLANEARWEIEIVDHLTGAREPVNVPRPTLGGHSGGDEGIMRAFVAGLRGDTSGVVTSARESLESHLLAFAAEQARVEGAVVGMADYRRAVAQQSLAGAA